MITSSKINSVQEKIKLAISQIEKEEQVKINFGTCSYNNKEYTTRMKVTTLAKDEVTMVAVGSVNGRISQRYGFQENIIGKSFTNKRGTHTIVEFKTTNRNYPIITNCTDGKSYKMSPSQVKMYFN
jgi:hypothetical protein